MVVEKGLKQTEIGVIPEDWEVRELGEIGDFKNGINKSADDFGFGFPFVNLMDVFGKNEISVKTELGLINSNNFEKATYNLISGDVLFIRSSVKPSGVGLTALVKEDIYETVYSGFLIRYRERKFLTNEFKKYCFFSERFRSDLIANSTVSANTNINQEALKKLKIGFPKNKVEQTAIANALSDMDALIAQTEKLIEKKKATKQGVMQELLKPKEGWVTKKLGEVCEIKKGQLITDSTRVNGDIPVIAGGKTPAYYHNKSNRLGKTITISGSGASAGYVSFHNYPIFASDCSTISSSNKYNVEFIFYWLQLIQSMIFSLQTGGAQPHIHPSDLNPLDISLPPIEDQDRIAIIFWDLHSDIDLLETKLQKLKHQKQGIMQALLTGKIRLI